MSPLPTPLHVASAKRPIEVLCALCEQRSIFSEDCNSFPVFMLRIVLRSNSGCVLSAQRATGIKAALHRLNNADHRDQPET
jgi:hypothetical protein